MRVGSAQESMFFETVSVEWQVPTASFLFESELMVGVRTARADQGAGRRRAQRRHGGGCGRGHRVQNHRGLRRVRTRCPAPGTQERVRDRIDHQGVYVHSACGHGVPR